MLAQPLRRFLPLVACGVLIAASAGCAAEARGSSGQGGADAPVLCLDLQDLGRAVTKAKTLTSFSQQADVKKLRADLDESFAAVEQSAPGEGIDVAALEKEVDRFDAFVTRVPPGMTVGQFGSVISSQAAVVAKEQAKVVDAAGCTAAG